MLSLLCKESKYGFLARGVLYVKAGILGCIFSVVNMQSAFSSGKLKEFREAFERNLLLSYDELYKKGYTNGFLDSAHLDMELFPSDILARAEKKGSNVIKNMSSSL